MKQPTLIVYNIRDTEFVICTLNIVSYELQYLSADLSSNADIFDIIMFEQYHYDWVCHALDAKHIQPVKHSNSLVLWQT